MWWTKYTNIRRQVFASINLIFASLCYGMTFAFSGTLWPLIQDYVDEGNETWLATINVIAIILGAHISLHLMPYFGNRICLLISDMISIIGWFCLSFASQFFVFAIGCTMVGLSSGVKNQISLIYRVEIPQRDLREIISIVITSCYMLGILLGHLSAIILPWRIAMRCCSFIPLISIATIAVLPESPSWLLHKKRETEAKEIYFWLRGVTPESEQEFNEMLVKAQQSSDCSKTNTLKTTFSPKFMVPFFISSMLLTAHYGSGYDIIVICAVYFLTNISPQIDADNVTIIFDIISLISCILSCYVVKKMTRRGLFFASAGGTILTLILLIAIISCQLPECSLIPCLCLYTAFVNVGILPVSWLITAEIFPETNRDLGMYLSTGYFTISTCVLVKLIPIIDFYAGIIAVLILFCGLVLISTTLIYFIMPETKELSLQEIEIKISQSKFYQYVEKLCSKIPNKT